MTASDTGTSTPSVVKLITADFLRDPYPALASLRESRGAAPVVTNGLRMWVITRYKDARRILGDPAFGKDLVRVRHKIEHLLVRPEKHAKLPRALRASMFERDGEDHRRLRSLLAPAFTHQTVAGFRPEIERLADKLLDTLDVGKQVDLVSGFARPLASTFLSDLLGIPEGSREQWPDWENSILASTTPEEVSQAASDMYQFCREMVQLKRATPGRDLFTELIDANRKGALDEDELVATFFLLLIGGVEPTSAIANGALTLLTHPEQLERLRRDPALLPACIDEILRFESSFRMLPPRYCPHAVELDDVTIPAHELVVVANSAANRDPVQFDDPDTFDITRRPRKHMAFGHGPHRCLGAALGKLEMSIGLGKLFTRFPDTRLAVAVEDLRWRPATHLRRLESLPVVLQ